jgi:uncharacterized RmlC-like cupin family protein
MTTTRPLKPETKVPYVVKGPQDAATTIQTRGMVRQPGITAETAGAARIWLGLVTAAPNEAGQPHHHGEAETAAYVLSGKVRVYYGEDFKEFVEAGPGDFLFVPPHTPHIECNPFDEPHTAVLARSPDNVVINLGK